VDRVQYPNSANPSEEVSKLDQELEQSAAAQHDVLAPKEYDRAIRHLNEAKRELADRDMDDFWDELGTAKAYLDKSGQLADVRGQRIQGALQARQKAIDAGARRFDPTRKSLHELDDSFKKNAASLDKKRINGEIWDRAVVNYGALQVNTVREANLGEARTLIKTAKDRGARTYAPNTLRNAQDAVERAERAIADQPENAAAYTPLANRANELARTLIAVTATARRASGQTNEQVARDAVARNQALASTKAELQGADAEAALTREALAEKDASLRGLAAANVGLRSEQEWNQAINEAREEFSEDEADVYRQGDKLLIRLKKINFPTGSAEVPDQSKELLTKVATVVEELNAKNVEVQGHTDSTGSPAINQRVSKDRAEAVADYLEDEVEDVKVKAVGYGYKKPIAANKSKAGRAMNRRVDVVITPTKLGASEDDSAE
jgi:outer membrane protein OmpA-like peptidoglycan-associated protein